jgi:recombination protein RecT
MSEKNSSKAIEKKDPASTAISEAKTLADIVVRAEEMLAQVSEGAVDQRRLARLVVLTRIAAQRNPDLVACTRESMFWAVLDAARSGLEWDGEHGALVPYNVKGTDGRYRKEAKFLPMYRGLVHLLVESGAISGVEAVPVYKGDRFSVSRGTNPHIEHEPDMLGDRRDEDLVAVYAVFRLRDGTVRFDVMNRADIDKRRASSRAKFGPWVDWYVEMALKTVVKHGSKLIPRVPAKAVEAINVDNRAESGERSRAAEEYAALLPGEYAEQRAAKAAKKGLEALGSALSTPEPMPVQITEVDPPTQQETPAPTPEGQPSVPTAADDDQTTTSAPTPISDQQREKLLNLCDRLGAIKGDQRLALVNEVLGASVSATSALTSQEAALAIAGLEKRAAERPA